MLLLGSCSLTPPTEFQAYPGDRRTASEHAAVLSIGAAFVTHVDSQQTGSLLSGGFPSTLFVEAGMHRLRITNSRTQDTVYLCFRAVNGGVYSVVDTAAPMSVDETPIWLRDNAIDEEIGYVVGFTEDCDPSR